MPSRFSKNPVNIFLITIPNLLFSDSKMKGRGVGLIVHVNDCSYLVV